jgi:hypothetical protein
MKKNLPLFSLIAIFLVSSSCSHKYYTAADFEEETMYHKLVAVLPAEMIFTGKQPKNLAPEDIAKIEEQESAAFQLALYNSILRHANSNKYITIVNFQDVNTTQKLLEQNHLSVRESWKADDKELAGKLGVDAVIKMRVQKQRYMSDEASYGITVAKQILYNTGITSKVPMPYTPAKTNDIYTSCSLISNNQTLWNDNYKSASDYNSPANAIIEGITDNFGKHFPYKRKRGK